MLFHHNRVVEIAFAMVLMLPSGCASHLPLNTDPETAEKILRASESDPVRVIFDSGDTAVCYSVIIREDSTRWKEAKRPHWKTSNQATELVVPTAKIKAVIVSTPRPGIGFLIGAAVGSFAGGLIGNASGSAPTPPTSSNPFLATGQAIGSAGQAYETMLIGAGVGALVGGLTGMIVGGSSQTVYSGENGENSSVPKWGLVWDAAHSCWVAPKPEKTSGRDSLTSAPRK